MQKQAELYRGKAKTVYSTENPDLLILEFRNDTSAGDGARIEQFDRKGMVNNKFNHFIMSKLAEAGIPTQMEALLSDTECLVKKLDMVPVECVVRNRAAGSLVKRLGIEEGIELNPALRELVAKVKADDPFISGIRIGQNAPGIVRLVIDLKQAALPQVFALTPVAAYQHRLVLDLHPAQAVDPLEALISERLKDDTQTRGAALAAGAAVAPDALGELIARHAGRPPKPDALAAPPAQAVRPAAPPPVVVATAPPPPPPPPSAPPQSVRPTPASRRKSDRPRSK